MPKITLPGAKVVLLVVFGALLNPVATANAADLQWGVNGHPLNAYPGISYEKQIELVANLGAKSYRVDVSDRKQAEAFDTLLAVAKKHGIEILPVLTPAIDLAAVSAEDAYRAAYDFAQFYVYRFKADIRTWELGNELESFALLKPCEMRDDGSQYPCEWGLAGGVGPLEYFGPRWRKVSAVLKGMSDATVAVDPTVRKAMGTAGWGHVGAFERMKQDGIAWDISVWHAYGKDMQWGLERVSVFGKPIWVTEFNHPNGSQKGTVAQARGLAELIAELRALRAKFRIEAAHIYELIDETYWAPDYEAFMGLVYLNRRADKTWVVDGEKPAYCMAKKLFREHSSPVVSTAVKVARRCDVCLHDIRHATPAQLVAYAYCLARDSEPDASGLNAWTADIVAGKATVSQMLTVMVEARLQELERDNGPVENGALIRFIYSELLGREPDGQGYNDYLAALDQQKIKRSDFVASILRSDEFSNRHGALTRMSGTPTRSN